MRDFPPGLTDYTPGDTHRPWTASPGRFLAWHVKIQGSVFWWVALLSVLWLLPSAVAPWALGHAIDEGILGRDLGALLRWAGVLAIFTVGGACIGWLHHTLTVRSWLIATFGTRELVQNKATELGHALGRHTPTGEVLAVAESDASQFGQFLEVANRVFGHIIAYLVVAVIVLNTNVLLGIIVLAVAPLLAFVSGPLLRPLQRAQTAERSRNSELTSMATDIVAGLRILRGIGGESTFGNNYEAQSQRVRAAGVRAGLWAGAIDAIGVLLSGVFVVVLMYLGSKEVEAGNLSVGGLVAFLGYALFLIQPIRAFFEFAQKLILARVSAEKAIALLNHDSPWPSRPKMLLDVDNRLVDEATGAVLTPGELTMVVSADPAAGAALADRIGRYLPATEAVALDEDEVTVGAEAKERRRMRAQQRRRAVEADREMAGQNWGVTLGGVDLAEFPIAAVRERIMVLDAAPAVFAGTLQEALDPHGRLTRDEAEAALSAAGAHDVFEATPGGWQGHLDERGRGLSGGQRQRLVLARALAARPEILVLVEPTSAVDAHTEAHIAEQLPRYRDGATTLVVTSSPLLLRFADRVLWLEDGRIAASGSHEALLGDPNYRAVVVRGADDEPARPTTIPDRERTSQNAERSGND